MILTKCTMLPARFNASTATEWGISIRSTSFTFKIISLTLKREKKTLKYFKRIISTTYERMVFALNKFYALKKQNNNNKSENLEGWLTFNSTRFFFLVTFEQMYLYLQSLCQNKVQYLFTNTFQYDYLS